MQLKLIQNFLFQEYDSTEFVFADFILERTSLSVSISQYINPSNTHEFLIHFLPKLFSTGSLQIACMH